MDKKTNYNKSFSGSVGAGMKSVFGAKGRRFYELEFRTTDSFHHAGESQKIIVDQLLIGRDKECGLRIGPECETVSRHHASIEKAGDGWKLVHLSQTNSTYVNGQPVRGEWFLRNGDEIQLSTGGPRFGFLVKEGSGSLVRSINLTSRLSLFRQQALRPYKRAITTLAIVLAVVVAGGTTSLLLLGKENRVLRAEAQQQRNELKALDETTQKQAAELDKRNDDIKKLRIEVDKLKKRVKPDPINPPDPLPIDHEIEKNVYFVAIVGYSVATPEGIVELNVGDEFEDGVKVPGASGTGFLLSDGRFVTAHHVVEPWEFFLYGGGDEFMTALNMFNSNGLKVEAKIVAVSPTGDKLSFTSSQFTCDRHTDYQSTTLDNGAVLRLAPLGSTDYGYARVSRSDGLAFDAAKSKTLKRGTELTILGYTLGLGVSSKEVKPLYGNTVVSADNLYEGVILTTQRNFDHGNSGGPVFYKNDEGKLVVVGIVSGGMGESVGLITPISIID